MLLKKLILAAAAALMCAWGAYAQTPNIAWYTDNIGADTFYVANADQLAGLAQIVNGTASGAAKDNFLRKVVILRNDVDLTPYSTAGGVGWTPIGGPEASLAFNGVFDGNGKTVSNLRISGTGQVLGGLFGFVGGSELYKDAAVVRNLGVLNVDVSAAGSAGALAGIVHGRVENSYATGAILNTGETGGLVGRLLGSVENCYAAVNVAVASASEQSATGGLVGRVGGSVRNSYAAGRVSSPVNVGGLVGEVITGGSVTNSAALNVSVSTSDTVSQSMTAGRAIGRAAGTVTVTGVGALISMGGNSTHTGATSVAIDSLSILTVYQDPAIGGRFAAAGVWTTEGGKLPGLFGAAADRPEHLAPRLNSVGTGIEDDPYLIFTAEQLLELAAAVNTRDENYFAVLQTARRHSFALAGDIDLGVAPYNTGAGWTPIGTAENPFAGHFDGRGHKISGLFINNGELDNAGLFGIVDRITVSATGWSGNIGAPVENFKLEGVNVTGGNNVGGAVGRTMGYVNKISVSGTVKGKNNVGGVAGILERAIHIENHDMIDSSSFDGTVNGTDNVGGIVGILSSTGTLQASYAGLPIIRNCFSAGTITGGDNVGGIAGSFTSERVLTDSYSASNVTGKNNVGGIAGVVTGVVRNCYAINKVTGAGNAVGGILGTLAEGGSVTNCAALNESISFSGYSDADFGGRVVGQSVLGNTLTNNVAFAGMAGHDSWSNSLRNGTDISVDEIGANGAIGGRFTASNGWTVANGKLPGLRGQTVNLPVYLGGVAVAEAVREVSVNNGSADVAVVVPAVIAAGEFTAGPNVAPKTAGGINFFWTGKAVNNGVLTIYGASGNVVRKINIADNAGAGRRAIGSWDLRDAKGRAAADGAYLVKGSINTRDGKTIKVSTMIGVR